MKVLVIEDDLQLQNVLKVLLVNNNFQVELAENGQVGIDAYKANKPEIVLMDIKMPIKDGVAASKEILEYDEKAKIIMLTCYSETNVIVNAARLGVTYFIDKPLDIKKLLRIINKVADNKKWNLTEAIINNEWPNLPE